MQYYKLHPVLKGSFYFLLPQGFGSKKFTFTFEKKDSWQGWQKKFLFLSVPERWSYVPTRWASGC